MLGRVLEDPTPEFGVVLIERGHEVGGGEVRGTLGTMARIVEVDARAGFVGLVAIGTRRLRVVEWLPDDPYPQAIVEELPELVWDDSLIDLHDETEASVREALRALEVTATQRPDEAGAEGLSAEGPISAGGWPSTTELADDPLVAAWQLAGMTPVGPLDAVGLLGSTSTEALLVGTRDLARQASELAALMRDLPPHSI